jgi:hypothetical protein
VYDLFPRVHLNLIVVCVCVFFWGGGLHLTFLSVSNLNSNYRFSLNMVRRLSHWRSPKSRTFQLPAFGKNKLWDVEHRLLWAG